MTTSTMNTTAWERTTRTQRALHALADAITHDPSALQDAVRRAQEEHFDSLDELLGQAHAQWVRTVDARIDVLLEAGAYGDQVAFDEIWAQTGRVLDGIALLLDHHREHPVVARAHAGQARRARVTLAVELPSTFAQPRIERRQRGGWGSRARALLACATVA